MAHSSKELAEQFESMAEESELLVIKSLLEATRAVFHQCDLFVVTNSKKMKPVIRIGSKRSHLDNEVKNRVVLSIGSPRNGKGPVVSWGGQGTKKEKALKSKIHKLDGVENVFGTVKGIELGDIDSSAIERYFEFLQRHEGSTLLQRYFDGNSICDLSFMRLPEGNAASSPKSVVRKPNEGEIEAWLNEVTILQEPLVKYLKQQHAIDEYEVSSEQKSDIGRIDIMLCPKNNNSDLPLAILELKFLGNSESNSIDRTKIRLAYGQLLDYSIQQAKQCSFSFIERWLVINHVPSDYKIFLEKLTELDSKFSVWTFNEEDKVPLKKQIGESYFPIP
ncbi:hypothetical protein ABC502_10850 [Alkalimonas sp. NCh-2]|uniref:hypothetical protein n=1 Tax=Alkalimonas sp. NCh-2 TaxID=3144846 RepID=UPI0031F60EEF